MPRLLLLTALLLSALPAEAGPTCYQQDATSLFAAYFLALVTSWNPTAPPLMPLGFVSAP
jgi:hypothetical protein